MANKHVLNPCTNSGMKPDEADITINAKGTKKALCRACNRVETVNKKNGLFRKHKAA